MHASSLPTGDRVEEPDTTRSPTSAKPGSELPAYALAVSDGNYFRGWRFGGRPATTPHVGRAKVFTGKRALDETMSKLRRRGVRCTVVNVILKIRRI